MVYSWKALEPRRGVYAFSEIEKDLALVSGFRKKLFIQIQDRFFSPEAGNIPKTGKPFTRNEFQDFATDYLGVDLIFWSPSAPWLKKAP